MKRIAIAIVVALSANATFAGASALKKDEDKHQKDRAAGQTHTFKDERSVRRYGPFKNQLQKDAKHPNNRHFTTASQGRLPRGSTAQKSLGLERRPKWVMTAKAQGLKADGKGHDKVAGGKHNMPELRVAKNNKAQLHDVQIRKLPPESKKSKK